MHRMLILKNYLESRWYKSINIGLWSSKSYRFSFSSYYQWSLCYLSRTWSYRWWSRTRLSHTCSTWMTLCLSKFESNWSKMTIEKRNKWTIWFSCPNKNSRYSISSSFSCTGYVFFIRVNNSLIDIEMVHFMDHGINTKVKVFVPFNNTTNRPIGRFYPRISNKSIRFGYIRTTSGITDIQRWKFNISRRW
jgi:hypothetical protein